MTASITVTFSYSLRSGLGAIHFIFAGLLLAMAAASPGTVNACGVAPTAVDVFATTPVSTASTPQSATVVLEGGDAEFDALTFSVVSGPTNGALSDPNNGDAAVTTGAISGQTLIYTPNTDYTGTDTFAYKVNDGTSDSTTQTVTITVLSGSAFLAKLGLDIDGGALNRLSGSSVALSSDGLTMAVGAPGTGSRSGFVGVYRFNGVSWSQLGFDIDGEAAADRSGYSVALSSDGHTLAVGARENDGTGATAGHVRVYTWSGSAWSQLGVDIDGEAEGDQSGTSVALSSDGRTLAVGAPSNDGTTGDPTIDPLRDVLSAVDVNMVLPSCQRPGGLWDARATFIWHHNSAIPAPALASGYLGMLLKTLLCMTDPRAGSWLSSRSVTL